MASEMGVLPDSGEGHRHQVAPAAGQDAARRSRRGPPHSRRRAQGDARAQPSLQGMARAHADRAGGFAAPRRARRALSNLALLDRQQAFGYTQEDLRILMAPMAAQGEEAVGSMGNDTPISALSDKPKLLFTYFKQNFAQVTNPPIDPIREELVMSLVSIIGPRPNLFDLEGARALKRLEVRQPILTDADLEKIRAISEVGDGHFKSRTLDTTWPAEHGAAGLEGRARPLCARAEAAVREGINIIILSDRRAGPENDSDAVAARLRGGASSPHPPGPAHFGRARGRVGRAARSASLLLSGRLWRGGDQSLSRLRDAASPCGTICRKSSTTRRSSSATSSRSTRAFSR